MVDTAKNEEKPVKKAPVKKASVAKKSSVAKKASVAKKSSVAKKASVANKKPVKKAPIKKAANNINSEVNKLMNDLAKARLANADLMLENSSIKVELNKANIERDLLNDYNRNLIAHEWELKEEITESRKAKISGDEVGSLRKELQKLKEQPEQNPNVEFRIPRWINVAFPILVIALIAITLVYIKNVN